MGDFSVGSLGCDILGPGACISLHVCIVRCMLLRWQFAWDIRVVGVHIVFVFYG